MRAEFVNMPPLGHIRSFRELTPMRDGLWFDDGSLWTSDQM